MRMTQESLGTGSDDCPGATSPAGGVGGPGDASWLCRRVGKAHPVPGRGARPYGDERRGTPTGRTWPGRTDRRRRPSHAGSGAPGRSRAAYAEAAACPRSWLGTDLPAPARRRCGACTDPGPAHGRLQLISTPVCGRLQFSFGSSSVLAPVRGWFQLLLASSSFQHQLVLAPVALRLQLIRSSLCLLKRSWLLARS
ncbi:uncharacterized protein LOC143159860 [Aptenodytes patagonicus]|uniref:uncharacterized protein LOC143159860 n=1 Tax=Aptenodytes patagonicus TaxID=9234 RepID=UPI003F9FE5A4